MKPSANLSMNPRNNTSIKVLRKLPHLFSHWEEVIERIRKSSRLLLCLDFDGTLVRIAPKPNKVRVLARTARLLRRLGRHAKISVILVSGRRRKDMLNYVSLPQVRCQGLYGWECNGDFSLSEAAETDLLRARLALGSKLPKFPGAWVEPKESSLSVHVRGVKPELRPFVRQAVRSLVHPLRRSLHVFENIRDIEILPWSVKDKGAAVRGYLARPEHRNDLPFYFGDDFSDEPAFRAVHRGISVLVGKTRPTSAQFRLRGPAEVTMALARIEEAIS
jgi:trehalose 6-phosphate phosphatase